MFQASLVVLPKPFMAAVLNARATDRYRSVS